MRYGPNSTPGDNMKVVTDRNPSESGLYVAYVQSQGMLNPYAEKVLLMWIGGVWGYPSSDQNFRGEVYGWMGPLPALKVL